MKDSTKLELKIVVVLEAIKSKKTMIELSEEFGIDEEDIRLWKERFLYNFQDLFEETINKKNDNMDFVVNKYNYKS